MATPKPPYTARASLRAAMGSVGKSTIRVILCGAINASRPMVRKAIAARSIIGNSSPRIAVAGATPRLKTQANC